MKKLLAIFVFAGTSVLMADCSSSKKTAVTNEMSTDEKVAAVKKNYSDAQMEEGKAIWQSSCNKCHKLFEAESRTVTKWENILPSMIRKARLTDEQGTLVRAYLLANAKSS